MTKKEKESARHNVEDVLLRLMDRKVELIDDLKNLIKDMIRKFGEENSGEWTLNVKNIGGETIHFLNADDEHLHVTPIIVYTNDYDEIGVCGEDGNYNQEDFEDVAFYIDILCIMFKSVFFER